MTRRIAAAAGVLLVILLAWPLAGRVGAHTDLLQGSPGPGQRVGGEVDFVDLVFFGPVTDVDVTLTGPDGEVVDGEMEVADGQIIRYRMEPLTAIGRYVVDYDMISEDGDDTTGSYFFELAAGATEPFRLGEVDLPAAGSDTAATVRNVAIGVAAAALVALCVVLILQLRQRRAALAVHRERQQT